MGQIKGILFDKDGCLLDFRATWDQWAYSFLSDLAAGDMALLENLAGAVEYDLSSRQFSVTSAVIAGTAEDGVDLMMPHLPHLDRAAVLAHNLETAAQATAVEIIPLAPFLSDLRSRGVALGVATNDGEEAARSHMRQLGAEDGFDRIFGADSGYGGKPAPGMLLAFAGQMGLAPQEVAMVGDSTHDLLAGRAAGMHRVAVLTGLASREALAPHADHVFDDIRGVLSLV